MLHPLRPGATDCISELRRSISSLRRVWSVHAFLWILTGTERSLEPTRSVAWYSNVHARSICLKAAMRCSHTATAASAIVYPRVATSIDVALKKQRESC
jgi:hypothetical protein